MSENKEVITCKCRDQEFYELDFYDTVWTPIEVFLIVLLIIVWCSK